MASNRDPHSEQTLVSPVSIPDELQILKNIDESNPTKIKKTSLPYNPILTPEKKHGEKIDDDDVTPMTIKKRSLLYTPMAIPTPEKKNRMKKKG
ncbi:hypothetical protein SNE40_014302 [Patella caerulea]|uniref:Uncharacterized protein n=1 Tax=Patella caerulea TaxID=87958 RepID=A0AAN8JE61_PATCE